MMNEYILFSIENNISISQEYVRFLVTKSLSRVRGSEFEEIFEIMEDKVVEVERVVNGTKSAAGSASNAVDQLKNKVESIEKNNLGVRVA